MEKETAIFCLLIFVTSVTSPSTRGFGCHSPLPDNTTVNVTFTVEGPDPDSCSVQPFRNIDVELTTSNGNSFVLCKIKLCDTTPTSQGCVCKSFANNVYTFQMNFTFNALVHEGAILDLEPECFPRDKYAERDRCFLHAAPPTTTSRPTSKAPTSKAPTNTASISPIGLLKCVAFAVGTFAVAAAVGVGVYRLRKRTSGGPAIAPPADIPLANIPPPNIPLPNIPPPNIPPPDIPPPNASPANVPLANASVDNGNEVAGSAWPSTGKDFQTPPADELDESVVTLSEASEASEASEGAEDTASEVSGVSEA